MQKLIFLVLFSYFAILISAQDKIDRSYSIIASKNAINLTLKDGDLNLNQKLNSDFTIQKTNCNGCSYVGPGKTLHINAATFNGCVCIAPGGTLVIHF
jgi:hypothetical protein